MYCHSLNGNVVVLVSGLIALSQRSNKVILSFFDACTVLHTFVCLVAHSVVMDAIY